jgi:two-component sensor histidine kinase
VQKRFGPPFPAVEGDGPLVVEKQRLTVARLADLDYFTDFPVAIFALNPSRQIVFMNDRCRALMTHAGSTPYGLRPGEAFACIHHAEGGGGCGTTHLCRFCGMAQSIAASMDGKVVSEECRFERSKGDRSEQLDLLVWSKPLPVGDQRFLLFAVVDISADKRRQVFERIFLHDLMNTATSISSLLRLLDRTDSSFDEYLDLAQGAADQLTDEIVAHRALRDAENGVLIVTFEVFSLADAVSAVLSTYRRIAESRGILFDADEVPLTAVHSDPILLKRVLANLLKNAVEACARGERVSLSCSVTAEAVELRIGNPAVMSEDVMANLFKRSFTTKGSGRGLGTYSARLFVEDYLGGTIRCESEEGKGTIFTVRLPV